MFVPLAHAGEGDLRLIIETEVADIDSTRLVIDTGPIHFGDLAHLPDRLGEQGDVLPSADKPMTVYVFVPDSLSEQERDEFVGSVEDEMRKSHPHLKIRTATVAVDTEKAEKERAEANARIGTAAEEIKRQDGADMSVMANALVKHNDAVAAEIKRWKTGFKYGIAKYKQWIRSNYTNEHDMAIGAAVGVARALTSALVWIHFNQVSVPAGFQILASFSLDIIFSVWEKHIDVFKGTHRLPGEHIPVLGYAIRYYNERPLLKSWIIGNLIGFVAQNYFRFWSWFEHPETTSAPWSPDALSTYLGAWSVGNIAGAFGAQGPRITRKKGYMSSRLEYFIYMSYGMLFQLGGWSYGLGWNKAVFTLTTAETVFKVGMHAYGRVLPWKEPRAIVFHPNLVDREIDEVLYKVGYAKPELHSPSTAEFPEIVARLKTLQSLSWKQKVAAKMDEKPYIRWVKGKGQKAWDYCQSLLTEKSE